jgi:hypothetical protein
MGYAIGWGRRSLKRVRVDYKPSINSGVSSLSRQKRTVAADTLSGSY